jgi:hypothetical protein
VSRCWCGFRGDRQWVVVVTVCGREYHGVGEDAGSTSCASSECIALPFIGELRFQFQPTVRHQQKRLLYSASAHRLSDNILDRVWMALHQLLLTLPSPLPPPPPHSLSFSTSLLSHHNALSTVHTGSTPQAFPHPPPSTVSSHTAPTCTCRGIHGV